MLDFSSSLFFIWMGCGDHAFSCYHIEFFFRLVFLSFVCQKSGSNFLHVYSVLDYVRKHASLFCIPCMFLNEFSSDIFRSGSLIK